ncbi:hypothetical protein PSEUBRA_003946 [Kalmanozyma brasiliensis GHG001]|uniref:Uncharacterized protein n=1 Tax=Kalmanozyma brasiliensis (strain GHG001) TaxID=1365824 RepID=V5GJG6_KALBG|nr:uncharacterized protein PSEUBRA_003946 [Kalmanozyma brasiliensis GHG001]EST06087.1 hypothetical protein PSEUBRA_003946 [Kalmanozyma brasiliensis GHG001]
MDSSRLPPETPRRQLLKRIHRRSSVLPSMDPASHLAASSSTSTTRSTSRRPSLNPDSTSLLAALEKHDEEEEDYEQVDYSHDVVNSAGQAHLDDIAQATDEPQHDFNQHDDQERSFDGDENGEEADWAQVDELMDTLQLRNQRILELEKNVSQLQRDLQVEKDRTRSSKGKAGAANAEDKAFTRVKAIKLEREFMSQEMILKGLQRDNEDKTHEVEALRRKMKVMSDFLARQYGQNGWEEVVFASSGVSTGTSAKESAIGGSPEKEPLSAVGRLLATAGASGSPRAVTRPKFSPNLGSDANMNPFSPAASSPTKGVGAINNDDMLIPTIANMQTPSSSPSKPFMPSSSGLRAHSSDDVDDSIDGVTDALGEGCRQHSHKLTTHEASDGRADPSNRVSAGLDPNVLLASIESVRLLMQGFERQNAIRRAALESTIEKALEAERRAERLQAGASTAPAMNPSLDVSAA